MFVSISQVTGCEDHPRPRNDLNFVRWDVDSYQYPSIGEHRTNNGEGLTAVTLCVCVFVHSFICCWKFEIQNFIYSKILKNIL